VPSKSLSARRLGHGSFEDYSAPKPGIHSSGICCVSRNVAARRFKPGDRRKDAFGLIIAL
jgi:hypothetical protein